MAEPEFDLLDLMFGQHCIAYEPGTTLGERAWVLAETVRRRFEKAGYVARAQNPALPEKAQQIIEKREREEGGFIGPRKLGVHIGHNVSPSTTDMG